MMIDVAMLDAQVAILENAIARHFATGEIPAPIGSRHPSITPFEAFATANGHIVIAAGNDDLFARLCTAIAREELATDTRFASNEQRTQNNVALKIDLERTLTRQPSSHWLALFEEAGIPCGPIQDVAQVLADPQIAARNMVVTANDPAAGPLRMAGNPIKLSAFDDPPTRAPAPELDADRARILGEIEGA
jgi:CoA:oxalate CoA-transferase